MHELYCPSCNSPSPYNFNDYLLMCPICSASFKLEVHSGHKEIFADHYIVPNTVDAATIKELTLEWLKRIHHRPGQVQKDFFVTDIKGFSVPLWIISLEGHTSWRGLVRKQRKPGALVPTANEYISEAGQFRRSYRWAVSARSNICEAWGFTRLHQPSELVQVDWDGFPLDSTLSRGKIIDEDTEKESKSAYDVRKFFDFKFANGLPVLGVQINDEEALRRAKTHVDLYHFKLAKMNVDYLLDYRTELEIAGVQLVHTPFWMVTYVYRPKNMLRYFIKPTEKRLLVDGYGKGVLNGELAVQHKDKILVNAIICAMAAAFFMVLGVIWHPSFYLVGAFSAIIGMVSFGLYMRKKAIQEEEELKKSSHEGVVAREQAA